MTHSIANFSVYKQNCISDYLSKYASIHAQQRQEQIRQIIEGIFNEFLTSTFVQNQQATVVIGPKCSGKTFFSLNALEHRACRGTQHVFLSLDHIYETALEPLLTDDEKKEPCGKNSLGELIVYHLEKATIDHRLSIFAEKDPTDPSLNLLLESLKVNKYATTIIYLTTPEEIRFNSFQAASSEASENFTRGAELFASRIATDYLTYAGEVEFHLRCRQANKPEFAASWIKKQEIPIKGDLRIFDNALFDQISRIQDEVLRSIANKTGKRSYKTWKELLSEMTV